MPVGGPAFSSVRKARAALMERAHELIDKHMNLIDMAIAAGDFETANKAIQYLEEHMPADEGERLLEISVDKPKQVDQKVGPTISIGFAIGGVARPKELPVMTIDAVPVVANEPV